jgi:redox-sensitive bicupin YhaK (pirin superfamily)
MTDMGISTRSVSSLHEAFRTLEGDGFEVRRAIPTQEIEAVGPFIFLDHFGPIDVKPGEAKGASAHPHAGIETLTLLLEGSAQHKDSLGNTSSMRPGDVQWLRAGRGVIHDESPSDEIRDRGGRVHGVQLWINMPKGSKHDEPSYRHVLAPDIPVLESADRGARTRLVAGRLNQRVGPVVTTGAPFVAHTTLLPGGVIELEPDGVDELAAYVMVGSAMIAGQAIQEGQLARLSIGDVVRLGAAAAAEIILIGGDPLDAPICRYGPFVMNSPGDLQRAMRDYQSGRMGRLLPVRTA